MVTNDSECHQLLSKPALYAQTHVDFNPLPTVRFRKLGRRAEGLLREGYSKHIHRYIRYM